MRGKNQEHDKYLPCTGMVKCYFQILAETTGGYLKVHQYVVDYRRSASKTLFNAVLIT